MKFILYTQKDFDRAKQICAIASLNDVLSAIYLVNELNHRSISYEAASDNLGGDLFYCSNSELLTIEVK